MSDNNQDDFQSALVAEFTPPTADDTTPPAPTPGEGEGDGGEETSPAAGTQVPPADEAGEPAKSQDGEVVEGEQPDAKQETAEEKANREAKEAAEAEPVKPLTAEDIRKVLAEDRTSTQQRVDQVHSAREDIINKLYPEGIDRKVYDTNGNVIKTAQDIVDRGLINKRTGEAYTYEEASSFMLEAGKKMAEQIEELNNWAEDVAEKNISLMEGNQRVMSQWGDILKAMPELAKTLADKYISTQLEFDKTGSYITRMATSPEDFYNLVMPAYKQLGEAAAAQNANQGDDAAAKAAAEEAARKEQEQNEQNERNGLPPQRGQSRVNSNTGDPMLDALVDELSR